MTIGCNGFGAYVPDLPGHMATAESRAEVVAFSGKMTGVPEDSVANSSQVITVGRITDRVGKLNPKKIAQILSGIDIILGG